MRLAAAGAVVGLAGLGYRLTVRGALTLDVGVGRRIRPLGPVTRPIAAPPELVFDVIAALAASGLSPQRLELEITETVMLHETETTLAMLRQIKALGVAISMDDFGTGYSSLSYLRKFPFDKIKIDQSFIRELSDAHESVAIVRAVMGLGTSLGMVTMAEGVETIEQLRTLQAEGCAEAQGFLFSPSVTAGEITELLERIHRDLAAA